MLLHSCKQIVLRFIVNYHNVNYIVTLVYYHHIVIYYYIAVYYQCYMLYCYYYIMNCMKNIIIAFLYICTKLYIKQFYVMLLLS